MTRIAVKRLLDTRRRIEAKRWRYTSAVIRKQLVAMRSTMPGAAW